VAVFAVDARLRATSGQQPALLGEHRAPFDGELAAARVVDLGADRVGGQQSGGELDAAEGEAQALGVGAHGQVLGQAGDALDEVVAAGAVSYSHSSPPQIELWWAM